MEIQLSQSKEDESLQLLVTAPDEKLEGWLTEFYGKQVQIASRQLLRHRDLSYVERIKIADALPESIIYKLVLPPWDVEQDLHERILIPSITNSAQLFLSANYGSLTAMFIEDVGTVSLIDNGNEELAARIGQDLAKLHRSYCYRTDELMGLGILRTLFPLDYEEHALEICRNLRGWQIIDNEATDQLVSLARTLAENLAGEPTSLVHGDLYAENIILRNDRFHIIDWSWFTILGVPLMDLSTLTSNHYKNGPFFAFAEQVIDAYCFESGRDATDVSHALPFARLLSRLLFLDWLVERRKRGIMGTTVGPVDGLIQKIVNELHQSHQDLSVKHA